MNAASLLVPLKLLEDKDLSILRLGLEVQSRKVVDLRAKVICSDRALILRNTLRGKSIEGERTLSDVQAATRPGLCSPSETQTTNLQVSSIL